MTVLGLGSSLLVIIIIIIIMMSHKITIFKIIVSPDRFGFVFTQKLLFLLMHSTCLH